MDVVKRFFEEFCKIDKKVTGVEYDTAIDKILIEDVIEGANELSKIFEEWDELDNTETTDVIKAKDPLRGAGITKELINEIEDIIAQEEDLFVNNIKRGYYIASIIYKDFEFDVGLILHKDYTDVDLLKDLYHAIKMHPIAKKVDNFDDFVYYSFLNAGVFKITLFKELPTVITSKFVVFIRKRAFGYGIELDRVNIDKKALFAKDEFLNAIKHSLESVNANLDVKLIINFNIHKIIMCERKEIREYIENIQSDAEKYTGVD